MPFVNTQDFTTMIYEYNRGDKVVKVDPAIVWRKLHVACHSQGETFDQLMARWSESILLPEDDNEEIIRKFGLFSELEPKIEAIAREAFGIPPLDENGNGGTVALAVSTLNEFLAEREKKSDNTATLPSSLPPTAGDHPDSSKALSESNV